MGIAATQRICGVNCHGSARLGFVRDLTISVGQISLCVEGNICGMDICSSELE